MVCAAMGLCQSQQAALAKVEAQEQLKSNEIPQIDLSQQVSPFFLNIPELLYPQESPKQEAPKQEPPKEVQHSTHYFAHKQYYLSPFPVDENLALDFSFTCSKVIPCARIASSS